MKDIRIAMVTFNALVGQTGDNVERMRAWVRCAKIAGAAIVCFPEMNMTGYSISADMARLAEACSGRLIGRLEDLARQEGIIILSGMAEKTADGRIYASHIVLTPRGGSGVYRKLHIAPPEKALYSPGHDIALFDAPGLTFGVQLCYDAHFPELARHMALNGADLIFMPHASPRGTPEGKYRSWMRHLPARAYDNGLFVAACNQVGDNRAGLCFPGVAVVIGPTGEVLSKKLSDVEDMTISDLRARDLKRVRGHRMRYFLPYRRTDLFRNNCA